MRSKNDSNDPYYTFSRPSNRLANHIFLPLLIEVISRADKRISEFGEARNMLDVWTAANLVGATRSPVAQVGGRMDVLDDNNEPFEKPKKPLK